VQLGASVSRLRALMSSVALHCELDMAALSPVGGVLCSLSKVPRLAERACIAPSLLGAY
jgi:hypothetical protein